ncbi:MAG: HNH endonuclease [Myxococcota bacterium]|jgi:5-methylcytosine-specific restriction endonuclease McrA|nr:HNH endonuclease [Myxococcota bacterium]
MLNTSVLVLNRSFLPIHVTSVRRAFSLIYSGGAEAVNQHYETFDFDAWCVRGSASDARDLIRTLHGEIAVPRVIYLRSFDRVPRKHVRFSRANIFSRDTHMCQYCAEMPPRSQLNLDHVIPRAQGGKTTWENVVCCCIPCNRRKGGRTPEQAGVKLRKVPRRPRWSPLMSVTPHGARYQEWRPFLGEYDKALDISQSAS